MPINNCYIDDHCWIVIADTVSVSIRVDVRGMARGCNVTFLKSCLNIKVKDLRLRLGFTDSVRVRVRFRVRFV